MSVSVERDVPFLGVGREEKLDLYLPDGRRGSTPLPGVVVIHGGGWFTQRKDGERERRIATTIAERGYACASLDYRLVDFIRPELAPSCWPGMLQDCMRAVHFLREHARSWGGDARAVGAVGGSAGGHLAAMLACAEEAAGLDPPDGPSASYRVQAAVSLYGVGDVGRWVAEAAVRRRGMDAAELMLGGPPAARAEAYRRASPVYHVSPASAPLLLVHGTADEIVPPEQSELLAAALEAAGVPHELVLVSGAGHSFDLEPPQADLRPAVVGFLDRNLKRG